MEKRVKVEVEIEEKTLWWLFNEAHRRDITLNELVNKILEDYIDSLEKERDKHAQNRVRRRTRVR
jgi:hypothetical protein